MKAIEDHKDFHGIDASLDISLYEYGLICRPYTKDGQKDEHKVIYGVNRDESGNYDLFGGGFIREHDLDELVNGNDWMDKDDIKGLLSFVGSSINVWLKLSFITKLWNLVNYFGYENIMGSEYSPFEISEQ